MGVPVGPPPWVEAGSTAWIDTSRWGTISMDCLTGPSTSTEVAVFSRSPRAVISWLWTASASSYSEAFRGSTFHNSSCESLKSWTASAPDLRICDATAWILHVSHLKGHACGCQSKFVKLIVREGGRMEKMKVDKEAFELTDLACASAQDL
jgi:hypothetical protein